MSEYNNYIDEHFDKFEQYNKIQYQSALFQMKLSNEIYRRISDMYDSLSDKEIAHKITFIEKLIKQANDLQNLSNFNLKESMAIDEILDSLKKLKKGELVFNGDD